MFATGDVVVYLKNDYSHIDVTVHDYGSTLTCIMYFDDNKHICIIVDTNKLISKSDYILQKRVNRINNIIDER